MSATVVSPSTTATADMIGVSDLGPLIARLHSLLARVSSGEVVAPPAFEQRLFGGLIAQLTARPAPSPRSPRGERQQVLFPAPSPRSSSTRARSTSRCAAVLEPATFFSTSR